MGDGSFSLRYPEYNSYLFIKLSAKRLARYMPAIVITEIF